jgi:hypothetical protein
MGRGSCADILGSTVQGAGKWVAKFIFEIKEFDFFAQLILNY